MFLSPPHICVVFPQDYPERKRVSISLGLLSKDSWGIYSWEHKDFHFLTQQEMVCSQCGCQCYSCFVMAAQRKQLSMAWNSLRGKWWMASGISNLKRAASRATDSADFLHFTRQQYWLTANLFGIR